MIIESANFIDALVIKLTVVFYMSKAYVSQNNS
jgi:hypothetical protein